MCSVQLEIIPQWKEALSLDIAPLHTCQRPSNRADAYYSWQPTGEARALNHADKPQHQAAHNQLNLMAYWLYIMHCKHMSMIEAHD